MRATRIAMALALSAGCAANGRQASNAHVKPTDLAEAVSAAFAAARVDSLCRVYECDVVLVDTLVRQAPAIATYQLERLPVVGAVGYSRLAALIDRSVTLVPSAFRYAGAGGDTATVGFGVVPGGAAEVRSLTVLMPITMPQSYGGVFFVSLALQNGRWRVTGISFEEA